MQKTSVISFLHTEKKIQELPTTCKTFPDGTSDLINLQWFYKMYDDRRKGKLVRNNVLGKSGMHDGKIITYSVAFFQLIKSILIQKNK